MARSAQRNKRQPQRRTKGRAETPPKQQRRATAVPRSYEDEMFFPRLRRQAKWMFLVLALIFGLGYVIFNVGGTIPGTGIGDILQGAAQSDGRPDVGDAEAKVRENPRSAPAKLELADAYTQHDRPDDAIPVLEQYLDLRPNDEDVVSRLAGLYMGQGAQHREDAVAAQTELAAAAPGAAFAPASGLLAQLRGQGEVTKALSSDANERLSQASSEAALSFQQARDLYRKLGELEPDDASVRFSLASASEQAGDYESAIGAYREFIRLAPDDPNVPAIRQQIRLLQAQQQLQPQVQPSPRSGG
jgi:tetratricopeptide (TPR) repeat protein